MFSNEFREYTEASYRARLGLFGERSEGIAKGIAGLEAAGDEEQKGQALLLRVLYGTMPLCDAGDYDFDVFLSFVSHGLWLRKHVGWCRELPEELFLHYVLYYRVNTEGISPCREFFYSRLAERIRGLDAYRAALEVNYWCAEQAGYRASDERTLSPLAVYKSGSGRCGEESAFVVSALRSVGLAARQVYAPWWAHCDDNHAWVEVYVDGGWHFLGACEPEEALDRGWFTGAASRALLVHSRTFSDYWGQRGPVEECIGRTGSVWYLNETSRYARTKQLTVTVRDRAGQPAKGAKVGLFVLNMAGYRELAQLVTDEEGRASLAVGLGDLRILAGKDGWFGELLCLKGAKEQAELMLDRRWPVDESICSCGREEGNLPGQASGTPLHWEPPGAERRNRASLTGEQRSRGRARRQQAQELRRKKMDGFYDGVRAARFPEEQELLKLAEGNFEELYGFLSAGPEGERSSILHHLSPKDCRDVTAAVLESFLENVWAEEAGAFDREIYEKYVLCPRIALEELTPYPPLIRARFDREQQAVFRNCPEAVWEYVCGSVRACEEETYPALPGTPLGILRLGRGTALGRRILFVAILRSLGIPARLAPVDGAAEYWKDGRFCRAPEWCPGMLCLEAADDTAWVYGQNFGLAYLGKASGSATLEERQLSCEELSFAGRRLELPLAAGAYRLITTSRLPDGSQQAVIRNFSLAEGQRRRFSLALAKPGVDELLFENELEDFPVNGITGESAKLSSLLEEGSHLLAFLEVGQEPTEHVLNEMLSQAQALLATKVRILFFLEKEEDLTNPTLQAVLQALPGITLWLDPGFEHAASMARELYTEPEKLPLLVVAGPGLLGIYGVSGYHVGSVGVILEILGKREWNI